MSRAKTYDLFSLNKNEVISEPKEKKKRKKAYHNNLPKFNRKSKKSDYIDKQYIFDCFSTYQSLIELNGLIIHRKDKEWSKKVLSIHIKKYYDILVDNVIRLVNKMSRHPNFKGYPEAFKQDLIQDCLCRMLDTGQRESNEFYGVEYFLRFDVNRSENIFSYWTQISANFFIQFIQKHYKNENIKQDSLHELISAYDSKNAKLGIKFHLGYIKEGSGYGE